MGGRGGSGFEIGLVVVVVVVFGVFGDGIRL